MREPSLNSGLDGTGPDPVAFGSNAVRLSLRQCFVVAAVLTAVYVFAPEVWKRIEPLHTDADYRIPFSLSEDYWLYARYADNTAADPAVIPVVGDSVVWGQYVKPDETLSHALKEVLPDRRFANLGLNGSHPVALAGLLQHFGQGISNRKVLLHYNPLWTTSKRRDLQTEKASTFNHPQLVPQFFPRIPSYDAKTADRLSRAINCRFPFLSWTNHVRKTYFDNESLAGWAFAHPYSNPLAAVTLTLPAPEPTAPSEPVPWREKDAHLQSFEWVDFSESLQWAFFKQSLATLRDRGNTVFVLVGPFNEHLLTDESRAIYGRQRDEMAAWLAAESVPFFAPGPLPTELYADASHPLREGYVSLARQLAGDPAFASFFSQ